MTVRRIGGEEEGSERIRRRRSFVGPFVYSYGYSGGGGGGGGDGERAEEEGLFGYRENCSGSDYVHASLTCYPTNEPTHELCVLLLYVSYYCIFI